MPRNPLRGEKPMPQINVRVSEETRARLLELAQESRRTLSDYVRLVLEDYLQELDRRT